MQYIQSYRASELQPPSPWCNRHRGNCLLPWLLHPHVCSGLPKGREVCQCFSYASVAIYWLLLRQINMDYSLCKSLSYNMDDIQVALVMYDIMCQYGVNLQDRVKKSPHLSISNSLELRTGIGLFHIHGHKDSCLPRFSPSYIPGAKQVDGEIIESLWAPLNNISRSIRGMSLVHRQEVLDAHINHSNWKKMVHIGTSLQCFTTGILTYESIYKFHHFLNGGRNFKLPWMPVPKHLMICACDSSTISPLGLRPTKMLSWIEK